RGPRSDDRGRAAPGRAVHRSAAPVLQRRRDQVARPFPARRGPADRARGRRAAALWPPIEWADAAVGLRPGDADQPASRRAARPRRSRRVPARTGPAAAVPPAPSAPPPAPPPPPPPPAPVGRGRPHA